MNTNRVELLPICINQSIGKLVLILRGQKCAFYLGKVELTRFNNLNSILLDLSFNAIRFLLKEGNANLLS